MFGQTGRIGYGVRCWRAMAVAAALAMTGFTGTGYSQVTLDVTGGGASSLSLDVYVVATYTVTQEESRRILGLVLQSVYDESQSALQLAMPGTFSFRHVQSNTIFSDNPVAAVGYENNDVTDLDLFFYAGTENFVDFVIGDTIELLISSAATTGNGIASVDSLIGKNTFFMIGDGTRITDMKTIVATPEPSAAALAVGILAGALLMRRRRA